MLSNFDDVMYAQMNHDAHTIATSYGTHRT